MVGASYIKGVRLRAQGARPKAQGARIECPLPSGFKVLAYKVDSMRPLQATVYGLESGFIKNGEVSLSDFGSLMRVHYGSRKTGKT